MKPLVSVIVPTKNEEKLLPLCLSSLTHQAYTAPYEIIVVDTNSTDKTVAIAKSFGAKVVLEPRRGKVYAFQKGVSVARGKILCFTESDCIVSPTWLSTIDEAFAKNTNLAAVTGLYTFHNSTPLYQLLVIMFLPLSAIIYRLIFGHHSLRASNFAAPKKLIERVGGFNPDHSELYDVELSGRLATCGPIKLLDSMRILNSDRRIRGRLNTFLLEFVVSFYSVFIHKKPMKSQIYEDIR